MKIMTFNLRCDFILDFNNRWDVRKDIAVDLIKNYKCDCIGVQEVTKKMHDYLYDRLENYNIVGMPRSKKVSDERNDILISKQYEIEEYKTFWLSDTPEKIGSSKWYSLYPRICTTAIVKFDDGTKIRVYNTHLDCLLPQARNYGIKKLSKFIDQNYKEDKLPVVVMGDFNAGPNSKVIKNFSTGKYNDKRFFAVQEKNTELYKSPTRAGFKGKDRGFHIDYIFVSEELEIVDVDILSDSFNGKYPSDHFPILANIKLKSQ